MLHSGKPGSSHVLHRSCDSCLCKVFGNEYRQYNTDSRREVSYRHPIYRYSLYLIQYPYIAVSLGIITKQKMKKLLNEHDLQSSDISAFYSGGMCISSFINDVYKCINPSVQIYTGDDDYDDEGLDLSSIIPFYKDMMNNDIYKWMFSFNDVSSVKKYDDRYMIIMKKTHSNHDQCRICQSGISHDGNDNKYYMLYYYTEGSNAVHLCCRNTEKKISVYADDHKSKMMKLTYEQILERAQQIQSFEQRQTHAILSENEIESVQCDSIQEVFNHVSMDCVNMI